MQYVLAVDLGTSGPKAAVISLEGRIIATSRAQVATLRLPEEGAEQEPQAGRAAANQCTAFMSLLTDNRQLNITEYDPQLLRYAGIERDKLPDRVPLDAIIGTVLPEVAAELVMPLHDYPGKLEKGKSLYHEPVPHVVLLYGRRPRLRQKI